MIASHPGPSCDATFGIAEEIAGNVPLALKGIRRTVSLIEASAPLAAEARWECKWLMAAALQSQNIKEAQLASSRSARLYFVPPPRGGR